MPESRWSRVRDAIFAQAAPVPSGPPSPPLPEPSTKLALREPDAIVGNGNGRQVKALTLGAGVIPGTPGISFFGWDGTKHIVRAEDLDTRDFPDSYSRTAYAASAYLWAALRYRARRVAEAPLMVVTVDPEGNEEWDRNHPLEELLDDPSPDYEMSTLLTRSQLYYDITGASLWVKDDSLGGRVGRLTPFSGDEFTVEQTKQRIYGRFRFSEPLSNGTRELGPEGVIFFQEVSPYDWHVGTSMVEVCCGWLNLSQRTMRSVRSMLLHGLWPSVAFTADKDWNPDPDAYEKWKKQLEFYGRPENKGKPMGVTGGGKIDQLQLDLANLIPSTILDRVETVVASVTGIPAVVLQYEVGLKNSPWSQMAEARTMCTQDTIVPLWKAIESRLTRQLLWVPERDRTKLIRFDTSDIPALQPNRKEDAEIAKAAKETRSATRNEIRSRWLHLDPTDDPADDELPEFEPAPPMALGAGAAGQDGEEQEEEEELPEGKPKLTVEKMREALAEQTKLAADAERELRWKVWDARTGGMEMGWLLMASGQLDEDRTSVLRAARAELEEGKAEPKPASEGSVRRLIARIERMDLAKAWRRKSQPLVKASAAQAVSATATEIGVSFSVLQPGVAPFAREHAAELVTSITNTTKEGLKDLLEKALTDGSTVMEIAARIADSGVFAASRAQLIARTETTAISNGASRAALEGWQKESGAAVEKSWLSAREARVRDEHAALDDGSFIPIDQTFDNGLSEPGEPNCRCTLLYRVRED